jgi:hypothetical protein
MNGNFDKKQSTPLLHRKISFCAAYYGKSTGRATAHVVLYNSGS